MQLPEPALKFRRTVALVHRKTKSIIPSSFIFLKSMESVVKVFPPSFCALIRLVYSVPLSKVYKSVYSKG